MRCAENRDDVQVALAVGLSLLEAAHPGVGDNDQILAAILADHPNICPAAKGKILEKMTKLARVGALSMC